MSARVIPTRLLFWAEAMTVSPSLILIRPERARDHPLIAHEQVHVAQMKAMGTLRFWRKYITSRAFRQRVEVEAYRVQLTMNPAGLERIAQVLATRYFLRITPERAMALLIAP